MTTKATKTQVNSDENRFGQPTHSTLKLNEDKRTNLKQTQTEIQLTVEIQNHQYVTSKIAYWCLTLPRHGVRNQLRIDT